jgi:hypothetical protein
MGEECRDLSKYVQRMVVALGSGSGALVGMVAMPREHSGHLTWVNFLDILLCYHSKLFDFDART